MSPGERRTTACPTTTVKASSASPARSPNPASPTKKSPACASPSSLLKQRRDAKRQNGFWLSALSESARKPKNLDDLRSSDPFYETFTAADLTPFAREYLAPERASIVIVNPE